VVPLRIATAAFVEALIDTGSTHTYLSEAAVAKANLTRIDCRLLRVQLATADVMVTVRHQVEINFSLGPLQATYCFHVLPSATADAILGTDFLREFKIVPDVGASMITIKGVGQVPMINRVDSTVALALQIPDDLSLTQDKRLRDLLKPAFFASTEVPFGRVRDYVHVIDTGDARPICQPLRRTSPAQRDIVREEVQKMLAAGAIRPSQSPWASPVTLVPKKDGATRFCIDFRRVNDVTTKDRHPLPRVDDMLEAMKGAKYFSSLDAASGYWQIPVAEEDVPKTAFICTEGLFEWQVMPFGLCNAPATYQRMMQSILGGFIWRFCVCYIDDILVYSRSFEEHLDHLRLVLERLKQAGLLLKSTKCEFAQRQISFLGHIVSAEGIRTDPAKVVKVEKFPRPTNPTEVRAFLGLAGYYRRFIKDFARIAGPLYDLTGNVAFDWKPSAEEAFKKLKAAFGREVLLHYPDFTMPFVVDCDASETGMGAVLGQKTSSGERPIAMESRKFTTAERKWHIREKEALAIKFALEKFRHYLLGAEFVVRTDHSSLTWLFKAKTGRLQRWALVLQEFLPFTIQHRAGKTHANVDAFTRSFADSECVADHMVFMLAPTKFQLPNGTELVEHQKKDQGYDALKAQSRASVRDGVLGLEEFGRWRPYLPASLIERVVRVLHEHPIGSHFGPSRIRHLLAQLYVCSCNVGHIRDLLQRCELCARRRPIQPHGPLRSRVPDQPWKTVAMDFCGPYPESRGYRYVLVFVDQFTKWVELVPTIDQNTITVIEAFYANIICRHGCPKRLLSDNGPSFRSRLLDTLCQNFGIEKIFSTAYYPQGDGYAERFMRTLNNSLSALTHHTGADWSAYLPGIAFGYNITNHAATDTSPFELLRGMLPHLPGGGEENVDEVPGKAYVKRLRSVILNATQRALRALTTYHEKMKRQYDKKSRPKEYEKGAWVLVRLSDYERDKYPSVKLAPRWSEPRRVKEVSSDGSNCLVEGRDGRAERVNINRLLPLSQDTWVANGPPAKEVETPATTPTRRDSSGSEGVWYGPPVHAPATAHVPVGQPLSEVPGPPATAGPAEPRLPRTPPKPVPPQSIPPIPTPTPPTPPKSASSQDSEPDLFEVEAILDHDATTDKYLVLWKGYAPSQATWQTRHDLRRVPEFLENFWQDRAPAGVVTTDSAPARKRRRQR
jgi:transposase InsO family protein